MNIHWLQHVPFEGLGHIESWAEKKGHGLNCTRFYAEDRLPAQGDFQMLVVMGGPMGVHDEHKYSWLSHEKKFIQETVNNQKPILGICLGAQLLASVLGAEVVANAEKEIGWYPVDKTDLTSKELIKDLPQRLTVFHWHGDTFGIPDQSVHLYSSEACRNQAFLHQDRVIGLQFHLETTQEGVDLLVDNCSDELITSRWIQQEEKLRIYPLDMSKSMNDMLEVILDYLASRAAREDTEFGS